MSQSDKNKENMNSPFQNRPKDAGFFKDLIHQARLVWYLLRDPDVPFYLKAIPALSLVYLILPTDLMPDIVPALGQLDDITIMLLGAKMFIDLSPNEIVDYYLGQLKGIVPFDSEKKESGKKTIIIDEDELK